MMKAIQMIREHKKAVIILATVVVLFGLWFYFYNHFITGRSIPTSHFSASYVFNLEDPPTMVGNSDYVFVAKVEDAIATQWPEGNDPRPRTIYRITVLLNIKGELATRVPIELIKIGGLAPDQLRYIVAEGDSLPEPKTVCLFNVNAQEDGSLLAPTPYSNIRLNVPYGDDADTLIKSIKETKLYQTYLEASQNPVKSNRIPNVSKYDESVIQSAEDQ
jgi:hypothetical protein